LICFYNRGALKFDRGQTTPFTSNTASLAGPWTALKGKALPSGPVLIRPPHPIGNWTWNGISSADFQRLFGHFVDSGMTADTISCHNNGVGAEFADRGELVLALDVPVGPTVAGFEPLGRATALVVAH
jgi:hypothetical protein